MNPVFIEKWAEVGEQNCTVGNHKYSVARLIELSSGFDVFDVPLAALNLCDNLQNLSLRKMVMHINAVMKANLEYPIILGEDGEILDGRHRVMKALHLNHETIRAVRFDVNPPPCSVIEED